MYHIDGLKKKKKKSTKDLLVKLIFSPITKVDLILNAPKHLFNIKGELHQEKKVRAFRSS